MIALMRWIATSALANAMNGPEWAFPLVESIHFLGFAFFDRQTAPGASR